jgi:hypothetical protein
MRKFIAIILMLVYANVGFATAINFHFCKGHLSKVSLVNVKFHSSCCCKTNSMADDCCKDKILISKSDNHQSQICSFLPEAGFKILFIPAIISQNEPQYNLQDLPKLFFYTKLRSPLIDDIFIAVRNLRI